MRTFRDPRVASSARRARTAGESVGGGVYGFDRDSRIANPLGRGGGQVGDLGSVGCQLDGRVVRGARHLTAAHPAQQVGAGRMVGVVGRPSMFRLKAFDPSAASLSFTSRSAASRILKPARNSFDSR